MRHLDSHRTTSIGGAASRKTGIGHYFRLRCICIVLPMLMASGCASVVEKQLESDINMARICEGIQANRTGYVKMSKSDFIQMVQLRVMGNMAQCDTSALDPAIVEKKFTLPKIESILLCGMTDDLLKNIDEKKVAKIIKENSPIPTNPTLNEFHDYLAFLGHKIKKEASDIETAFSTLNDEWMRISTPDNTVHEYVGSYVGMLNSTAANDAALKIAGSLTTISSNVEQIQVVADNLERSTAAAVTQERLELLANTKRFVFNARNFLENAQHALKGDVAMATRDAILNNMYYQFSYRTLDAIEATLSRAEKQLDKADAKVYGAISIGMVVGSSGIQDQLDKVSLRLLCRASQNTLPSQATFALAQAVCERTANPNRAQMSYLAPIIEKSFVKMVSLQAELNEQKRKDACEAVMDGEKNVTASAEEAVPNDAVRNLPMAAPSATAMTSTTQVEPPYLAFVSAMPAEQNAILQKSVAPKEKKTLLADRSALGVYMAHEWAARRALTSFAPVDIGSLSAANSGRSSQKLLLASAPSRDEVRRLAMSSSAAVLTELQVGQISVGAAGDGTLPKYLYDGAAVRNATQSMASYQSVQVTTSAVAMQNLTINGLTASAPQVQNLIVLPNVLDASAARANLCDALPSHVVCHKRPGGGYEIEAAGFEAGQYRNQGVDTLLHALAYTIKRTPVTYDVVIMGHASVREFSCAALANWREPGNNDLARSGLKLITDNGNRYEVIFKSAAANGVTRSANCNPGRKAGDGNHVLSFARAAWAGSVLEAPGKAEGVNDILGFGAIYASRQETRSDRRIVVQLTPR